METFDIYKSYTPNRFYELARLTENYQFSVICRVIQTEVHGFRLA